MFKFHLSNTRLPDNFKVAFICNVLNITYTELMQQPDDWVEQMLMYINQQNKAEAHRAKLKK